MTEIDRILAPININYEGNVDIKELYIIVKDFMVDKKYEIGEKEHNYSDKGSLKIKWEGTQLIDDYTCFVLKVTVKGSGIKRIKSKDREFMHGKFNIEIESEINKDYNDYYEGKPIVKFFRELFDHTVKKKEFNSLGNQLKDESYALFDELKSYFGLLNLK